MSAVRSAIQAHQRAIERCRSLDALCGGMKMGEATRDAAEVAARQTTEEERAAWIDVRSVAPENAVDLAGLAIHLGQVIDEFDTDVDRRGETFEAFAALRSACLALAGRGMVP